MSWNSRRKSSKFVNVLLVLICIVLVVILGGLLMTNRKEVQQESERLQELSEKQETGIDDYEAVKEHVSELEQDHRRKHRLLMRIKQPMRQTNPQSPGIHRILIKAVQNPRTVRRNENYEKTVL